jgi:hypothetical protein
MGGLMDGGQFGGGGVLPDEDPSGIAENDRMMSGGNIPVMQLDGRIRYPGQGMGPVVRGLGIGGGAALMKRRPAAAPAKPAEPVAPPEIVVPPAPPPKLTPVQQAASLETSFPHATDNQFDTGRDFRVSQEKRFADAAGKGRAKYQDLTLANQDTHLVPLGVHDALHALKSNPDAVGWYDRTVRKALGVLGLIHPEVTSDPHSAFAHRYALAVTSNGMKVDKNFELADKAYDGWFKSGATPDERRMPTDVGVGTAAKAINKSLGMFNDLVDQHGYEGAFKFLGSDFTVGQLKKMGYQVTGEKAGQVVKGAAVLGPKIGNGFYSNLNGHFDALTMDRWFARTWGRWIGKSIEKRPDMVRQKGEELAGHIRSMSPEDVAKFEATTGVKLNLKNPVATGLAVKMASTEPAIRTMMNAVPGGSNVRTTSNMLHKYVDGQIEQPTPSQRPFMRQTMSKILDNLHRRGYNLTMSDLQALFWYPEKRLYDSASKRPGKGMTSYDPGDPDVPDYAKAAVKLAKARGFTDEQINAALDAAHAEHTIRFQGGPVAR